MRNDFAVFILTNARPNRVKTYKALRDGGYTGKIYLILDNQDSTVSHYEENFSSDEIIIFNKQEAMNLTDSADNTNNPKAVVYARNMCHSIATKLGLDYFLVLDDDYGRFDFRSDDNLEYCEKKIKNLDTIFDIFLEFLGDTPAKSIAFSQNGDFIGGKNGSYGQKIALTRKCMNSFFCKTDRPFKYHGLINEDVTAYTLNASKGDLYFTSTHISLKQTDTQTNQGGLTDIYLELGTYIKSFYSVMFHPSSIVVEELSTENARLHHKIKWDCTVPKILREETRNVS